MPHRTGSSRTDSEPEQQHLRRRRLCAAHPGNVRADRPAPWTNYKVSVKMLSTDNDGIGLMFGYKDKNNYYRFSMDRQQSYRPSGEGG